MAKKTLFRFSNSLPFMNMYKTDFEDIINMKGELYIQTTWGDDIRGAIARVFEPKTNVPEGYKITLSRGTDTITEDIAPLEAITIFTGKAFNIRKLKAPFDLRNKISFAIGMNREKRMDSLEDLWALYREQLIIHDNMILSNIPTSSDKAYLPVRFDFGNFHIVVISDGYGQYNLADGYYFMDGFPSTEEALNILDSIPENYVDMRRIKWIKEVIMSVAEEASNGREQRANNREKS